MGKTCPSVAKSQVQSVFAVLEDVSGELQLPTPESYILPAGRATMVQTPDYSNSEELSKSLNVLAQFQNAVPAGTGSIPIYGRLNSDYSKPEGNDLFVSLMGDYNDPALITAKVATAGTASDTEIEIADVVNANVINENILAGKFPPMGVVQIGDEKILYREIEYADDGKITLKQCQRGYGNTVAAAIAEEDDIQMLSRIYSQSTCRQTMSIWILNDDKICLFMSGCVPTQDQVRLQRESGQMFTFDFQGRKMGWCGVAEIAESPTDAVIQLAKKGADAYTVGGYIQNKTQIDDNGGKGYRITAVNDDLDTITVSPSPTGWKAGDMLHPWLPTAQPIGQVIESRYAAVEIDGKAGKLESGGFTISTPTNNLLEIGDEYPGESVDSVRSIELERNIYFRAKDGIEFGMGYKGYEVPVIVYAGKEPGLTLAHYMPRVKFNTPELGESDNVVTMTQNGTALGVVGEDALFIIQV